MHKLHRQYPLLLLLITAFLAVQWSSAHIHQATDHAHSGSHHQHHSAAHSHQLLQHSNSSHHLDAIDSAVSSADNSHDGNVVQLDHECHHPQNKKQDSSGSVALISSHVLLLPDPPAQQYTLSPSPPNAGHLTRSHHTPRGPPPLA